MRNRKARESASDNKRLLHETASEVQNLRNKNNLLELRSQIQSAQAEEIIRMSRDNAKH